jgi:hypothetical protein
MNSWIKLRTKEKIEILDKVALTTGLPNVAIEKD